MRTHEALQPEEREPVGHDADALLQALRHFFDTMKEPSFIVALPALPGRCKDPTFSLLSDETYKVVAGLDHVSLDTLTEYAGQQGWNKEI